MLGSFFCNAKPIILNTGSGARIASIALCTAYPKCLWRRRLVGNERDVEMTQEELEELLKELPIILEELEKYNVVKDKPPLKKI